MTATMYIGDAIEVMSKLPEKSVDLILTSPPFLALRSYLPADHLDKALEGGSQATPGAFIDWLIDVVEACDRVLAPHGSMCIELGDTYAGSGGAGGDYSADGLRSGQPGFVGSGRMASGAQDAPQDEIALGIHRIQRDGHRASIRNMNNKIQGGGTGWPLAKSLSLIPELFRLTLVYGTNPLTGRQTERWRLRNVVRWVRPNPPVGALGDKFRPATSELMVFCKSAKRYFDLDAVREPYADITLKNKARVAQNGPKSDVHRSAESSRFTDGFLTHAGAPPLDWWNIPPGGYEGAHYAVFPPELCIKPIKAMSPEKVCRQCGEPSRRIVSQLDGARSDLSAEIERGRLAAGLSQKDVAAWFPSISGGLTGCVWNWENAKNVPTVEQWSTLRDRLGLSGEFDVLIEAESRWNDAEYVGGTVKARITGDFMGSGSAGKVDGGITRINQTFEWSDCGHDDWRPGVVLDPFGGSGTTALVATGHGRDCILIDLDERNFDLALQRVGPFILDRGVL